MSGAEDVGKIAEGLTEAQRRVLVATCQRADTKRGHVVNGHQSGPVRRLVALRLIYVEDTSDVFCRINMRLRPEPLGLAVKSYLEESSHG